MPDGLVAGRGVGEDDVLHLGVATKTLRNGSPKPRAEKQAPTVFAD